MRNSNKEHLSYCTFTKDGYYNPNCVKCYNIFIKKTIPNINNNELSITDDNLIQLKIVLKNGWYVEQNVKSTNQIKYHFFYHDLQLCNLAHDENKKFNKIMDLTNEKRICKRCIHVKNTWNDLNNYITFHN